MQYGTIALIWSGLKCCNSSAQGERVQGKPLRQLTLESEIFTKQLDLSYCSGWLFLFFPLESVTVGFVFLVEEYLGKEALVEGKSVFGTYWFVGVFLQ